MTVSEKTSSPTQVAAVNAVADVARAMIDLADSIDDKHGDAQSAMTAQYLGLTGQFIGAEWKAMCGLDGKPGPADTEAVRRNILRDLEPRCLDVMGRAMALPVEATASSPLDAIEAQQHSKSMLRGIFATLQSPGNSAAGRHFVGPIVHATARQDAALCAAGKAPSRLVRAMLEQFDWALDHVFYRASHGTATAGRLLTPLEIMITPADLALHNSALTPTARAANELRFVVQMIAKDVSSGLMHQRALEEYMMAGYSAGLPSAKAEKTAAGVVSRYANCLVEAFNYEARKADQPVRQYASRKDLVFASGGVRFN